VYVETFSPQQPVKHVLNADHLDNTHIDFYPLFDSGVNANVASLLATGGPCAYSSMKREKGEGREREGGRGEGREVLNADHLDNTHIDFYPLFDSGVNANVASLLATGGPCAYLSK